MRTVLILALVGILALGAPSARACSHGTPSLGIVPLVTPAGTFYLDDEGYVTGEGLWLWEESNAIGGLQRGGCSGIVPDDCWAGCYPEQGPFDTLIF